MDLSRLQIDRGPGPRRARRKQSFAGRLLVLGAVAAGLFFFRAPLLAWLASTRAPEVEAEAVTRVSAAAAAGAVSGTAANGYVVARRRAALSADTPGRIVEMNVEEGSVVAEGDVVARLFDEEVEAALRRADAELEASRVAVLTAEARVTAVERRREETTTEVDAAAASYDEAVSAVALAEIDFERAEDLLSEGVGTRERFDRAQAALVQAKARLAVTEAARTRAKSAVTAATSDVAVAQAERAQAEAQIVALAAARDQARATKDKTIVRAPFDGVIVLKDAEVGEVVSPNAQGGQSRGSVATMVDFASLEVQVELPETSLTSVELGMPADVFLDAFAGERFPGAVQRIWPTANRQKATIEVRVMLDVIDPRMRPEMGARVVFAPERAAPAAENGELDDALLVPGSAVVRRRGVMGVFVLEDERVFFRTVRVGEARGRRVEIEAGLEEGELVVGTPADGLKDGDRVTVRGQG